MAQIDGKNPRPYYPLLDPELDPDYRRIAKQMWDIAESTINLKPRIRVYKNGERLSVDLYNNWRFGTIMVFGTAGDMKQSDQESLYMMFNNPSAYNIVNWDNSWEDELKPILRFYPAFKNKENDNQ